MHLSKTVDGSQDLAEKFQNRQASQLEKKGLEEFDRMYDEFVAGDHNPTTNAANEVDDKRLRTFAAMHTVVSRQSKNMDPAFFESNYQSGPNGHEHRFAKTVHFGAGSNLEYYEGKLR